VVSNCGPRCHRRNKGRYLGRENLKRHTGENLAWESEHDVRDDIYMYGARKNSLITNTVAPRMVLKTRRIGTFYLVAARQTFRETHTNPGHYDMTGWIQIPSAVGFPYSALEHRTTAHLLPPSGSFLYATKVSHKSWSGLFLVRDAIIKIIISFLFILTANINTDNNDMFIIPSDQRRDVIFASRKISANIPESASAATLRHYIV
jgi:hypothetical protein